MNITHKEVGRLTITLFNKLYEHYKNNFALELRLTKANMTYKEAFNQSQKNDEWF